MKLFPTKTYEFEIANDYSKTLAELEQNTYLTNTLVSEWTKKMFIGQVSENGFRLISAKPRRGAFCVFNGKLELNSGSVEVSIHKSFQILLSIIYLFPIIGFLIALFTKEKEVIVSLIIPTLMAIIVFRFIFTELAFRFISSEGLKRLSIIMQITRLKKMEN
ncbi:hypothetical protein [Flavobacterium lacus]|uniref:Uncharacterized protein n=1 Tax=Flavobacterium lacus TaxID=1353778 RepID=A0A328WVG9_9FLAO|nr:hypothetical protein [Flavobacterium lacus]RAR46869.1 hypothetical protein B0I10_11489 [Flavobacterium lacus]